ncbi:hypothetical protein [Geomicrobium sp. JCM 19039]|uniref:LexA family protein n=1 Tax=Geomicrobium sp. JCM 19039 TaxID=1460636 RepID=UPI0005A97B6E|nr:hypothetical protein [Geomicrobium sp. JCM 19039]
MTYKQREALDVAVAYIDRYGYAPTFREISDLMNYRTVSTVYELFVKLKEKGYVTWEVDKSRTLKILMREELQ